jgi:hypothetical protein
MKTKQQYSVSKHIPVALTGGLLCMGACALDEGARPEVSTGSETEPALTMKGDAAAGNMKAQLREGRSPSAALLAGLPGTGDLLGPFRIQPQNSINKCLDVTGGPTATGNGIPVQQWDCFDSLPENQIWYLQAGPNGTAYVIAGTSLQDPNPNRWICLDVRDLSLANGAAIQQWDCSKGLNQRWITTPNTEFKNKLSGKCLDVTGGPGATGNGVPIQQWSCGGGANQHWGLTPI